MTFMDECTRMTGVYLKENRDEIPKFKLFKNYVKSVLCQNQSLTFSQWR